MKAISINGQNVAISLLYTFFGLITFFILKISLKYLQNHKQKKQESSELSDIDTKHSSSKLNLVKLFLKTYFFKNTLIGSIFSKDKKYLLKQLFILTSIGICCFKINKYIIWPFVVGLGLFLLTTIIFYVLIPLFDKLRNNKKQKVVFHQRELSSKRQSLNNTNSIQIQHTQLQISVSVQRDLSKNRQDVQQKKKQPIFTRFNIQLVFIMALTFTSLILASQSILNLSTSVSNSGVLNIVSLGMCFIIDQFIVRTGFLILSSVILSVLHLAKVANIRQNTFFVQFIHQQLVKEVKKIQQQRKIQQMGNKISNINRPYLPQGQSVQRKRQSQMQMVFQDRSNNELIPTNQYSEQCKQALRQQQSSQQQGKPSQINAGQQLKQEKRLTQQRQQQFNYFQLYPQDLQMYQQKWVQTARSKGVIKKYKKRAQSEVKLKSYPLLYFPYEENKLSSKRQNPNQQNQQQINYQQSINYQNDKAYKSKIEKSEQNSRVSSLNQENFISKIEVLDCLQDQIQNQQEPDYVQIGAVLHEKNTNFQTLPQLKQSKIPPSYRQKSKKMQNFNAKSMKKIKKVSPYLVDLGQQAIKPKKLKKLSLSNFNKENNKQIDNSFLPQQNIDLSHLTGHKKSSLSNFQTINIDTLNSSDKKFLRR